MIGQATAAYQQPLRPHHMVTILRQCPEPETYWPRVGVRIDGRTLRAHWNKRRDLKVWPVGHSRVTFNGLTFQNYSDRTVTVTGQC